MFKQQYCRRSAASVMLGFAFLLMLSANPVLAESGVSIEPAAPGAESLRAKSRPVPWDEGYYVKRGTAVYFAAKAQDIPDWDRLYWVMVRVLSEKYGCFITQKIQQDNMTAIRCRDQRRIMFWRSRDGDWLAFRGRQFDRYNNELVIESRRIVRRQPGTLRPHESELLDSLAMAH